MTGLQKFNFYGDDLDLIEDERGWWVAVKRVCEGVGIAEQRQITKLKEKPWAVTTMMVATGSDGKSYEMFAVHIDSLPMWLATIDVGRVVNPETKAKLERYQTECARVLRDRFVRPASALPPNFEALLRSAVEAATAPLRAEVLDLRNRLALLTSRPDYSGGVIGPREASASVLSPLRALARQLAHIRGAKYRSVLLKLDKRLRRLVSYPNDNGQGWDRFPADRYGEVTSAVGLLQGDAQSEIRLHAERVAREAQLPLTG